MQSIIFIREVEQFGEGMQLKSQVQIQVRESQIAGEPESDGNFADVCCTRYILMTTINRIEEMQWEMLKVIC